MNSTTRLRAAPSLGICGSGPLVAVVARLSRMLFGDSLRSCAFFRLFLPVQRYFLRFGSSASSVTPLRASARGTAMLLCPIYLTMDNSCP